MKTLLSFLMSRQLLAICAVVLIALALWFDGPLVAFDALRPLAGVGVRALLIAILTTGVLLWLAGRSIRIVFLGLVCLVIWYASGLVAFGNDQPFKPVSARVITIVIVLLLSGVYMMFRFWQRMRTDTQFLQRLLAFGGTRKQSPADTRLVQVNEIVGVAVSRLRAMHKGSGALARLFQAKRYLYELPWYIILGSKSSGKTSMLLNAGLSLPVAGQMQQATGAIATGTKSIDCWLTHEAVFIDTAGHYTRHGCSEDDLVEGVSAQAMAPQGQEDSGTRSHSLNDGRNERAPGMSSHATGATMNATQPATGNAVQGETLVQRSETDAEEWIGFLAIVRKYRPALPLNGVLLTVDLAELTDQNDSSRIAHAASLSTRLGELRAQLGIHLPVYLVVTKMDRLTGFSEYFSSLTEERRTQVWGFTLPEGTDASMQKGIHMRCIDELNRLVTRLSDGVDGRLQEEHDCGRRRRLAVLPEEFAALAGALAQLIGRLLPDSRYDETQLARTFRGAYFTSATQGGDQIVAERRTILQRLVPLSTVAATTCAPQYGKSRTFFLYDLLKKVVVPEAHLAQPDLLGSYRVRLLRLSGHALALLVFVWLALSWRISFGNNTAYLDAVSQKAQALAAKMDRLSTGHMPEGAPDPLTDTVTRMLTDARSLPAFQDLDLTDPGSAYLYGLYIAPDIMSESDRTYQALEDNLLLPQIVRRMEDVIAQAITDRDSKAAYGALRVYLMLYSSTQFNADDVKAWVLKDCAKPDGAKYFGTQPSFIDHVERLFSGTRIVHSGQPRNEALVQQARTFLDSSDATHRIYERAKDAMMIDAPADFTLIQAVGPQAVTFFTRLNDAPLARGVPGLFTFDGYHRLFALRLPGFVHTAAEDDAFVMGRFSQGSLHEEAQKKTAETLGSVATADDPLTGAIRRQYLMEYAQQWDTFLGDIRAVAGTSLTSNLQVLRSFAAPDSPLARLARAAVHETTLTRPEAVPNGLSLPQAVGQLIRQTDLPGTRESARAERALVDSHFAALREIVTGSADPQGDMQVGARPLAVQQGRTGMDSVTSLLNDYYMALTDAGNALSNNSMPHPGDAAVKLRMAADTMPPPLREVLLALGANGVRGINENMGLLLTRQVQSLVSDTCRLAIEGNYPFATGSQREVSIDDFTRVFAQGGIIDDFFTKTLAPFVDTSVKPWRYRTLPGATEALQGPDLEPFQHAKAIRDVFFGDVGQKQMAWKADIRIPELDPTITGLMIDIDGQATLYQHGPIVPFVVTWPGPRGGAHAQITASPRIGPETSTIAVDGPWALLRLMQKGQVIGTATPGRTRVAFDLDGRTAVLDIQSAGIVANPLTSDVLRTFRCPRAMPMFDLVDTGPPPGLPSGQPAATAAPAASH